MELEIVGRPAATDSGKAPLLLVHGVCHGAWCWENWLDWFAERGRGTTALSLRGHAGSDGRAALHDFGLADYRDDLLAAARASGDRPVLVGHSTGGAVAQLAVAADPSLFSAVVLLASLPPSALRLRESFGLLLRFRAMRAVRKLLSGQMLSADETLDLPFFDRRISRAQAEHYAALLQPESRRAIADIRAFRAPRGDTAPPMLVLGSSRDLLFGRAVLRRTAAHFDADLAILDRGCHDVMVDPAWPEYAARLETWLADRSL